jgi:hypothetical protein
MPVVPAVCSSSSAADLALAPLGGPESITRFLDAVAPGEVLRAVRHCLPLGATDPVLRLVRAKVKPGRTLTAEYGVALPSRHPVERSVSVTWVAPGATAPGPAAESEAEARRRRVLAPFRRAWIGSDDGRMSMSVSPVDHAFPQLVRLHDRRHLVDVLRATGLMTGVAGPTHEAFLDAYGVMKPARLARARAYDALLQLRMAARRISVQGPDWAGRVAHAIAAAVVTLAGGR